MRVEYELMFNLNYVQTAQYPRSGFDWSRGSLSPTVGDKMYIDSEKGVRTEKNRQKTSTLSGFCTPQGPPSLKRTPNYKK